MLDFDLSRRLRAWLPMLLAIAIGLALLGAGKTMGRHSGNGGRNTNTNNKNPNNPPSTQNPPPDTQSLDSARSDLATAKDELKKAQDAFNDIGHKLRDAADAVDPLAAALAELKAAQVAYDAAAKPVLAAVHAKPEYKAVLAAKLDAEKKVNDLRDANAPVAEVAAAANEALKQGEALSRLDADALTYDSPVYPAKSRLTAAAAKVAELHKQFDDGLPQNPDWVTTKKTLDDAKAKVATCEAAVKDAAGKVAAAQTNARK